MDINYIYDKLLEIDPNFKKFVEEYDKKNQESFLYLDNSDNSSNLFMTSLNPSSLS